MSNFIIQKTITGNFYHIYNNASTKINVSDFDVVLDDVALTFIIQCKNGSNIPSQAISINLIQVIDLSVGTTPIPFSGIDELILLLKSISYTPYLQSLIVTQPVTVYRVGQVGVFTMTPTQFTDNFDSNGLGKLTMLGWALRNGNNGTKNQQGKFSLNKGASPYDVIGALGGSYNSVLVAHEHDSVEYSDGKKSINTLGKGASTSGVPITGSTATDKTNKTSKVGISNSGVDAPSEDGVGKNMPPYLIDVWVERVTALVINVGQGGGSGAVDSVNGQTGDVYIPLDYLPLAGGTMDAGADINFDNGSALREGSYDFGGNGGISRICSNNYEDNWQDGFRHVFDQNGFIRHSTNCFDVVPNYSFDNTLRFKVDSLWTLDDGTTYKCTDASTGAAVWEVTGVNLTDVLIQGDLGYNYIGVSTVSTYTFGLNDRLTYNFAESTNGGIVFLDKTIIFPENSVIEFRANSGNGDGTTEVDLVPFQFQTNAPVYYKGKLITDITINTGDVCTLKTFVNDGGGINIWLLDIVDRSATTTSQLTNDGADGVNPFITALDIPPASNGLPTGGTAGQILTKVDATDYNATWQENYADWTSVVKHTVKNNGAALITKGTAVYATGSNGTNMLVGKASNATEAASSKTMGLMQSNITTTGSTQTGFVITEGLLSGLDTSTATAGDPVWLGVNGALIYGLANKPYAPAHLVFIGIVTKVSAGSGEIFVKVQNGFELKEIHDVDLITNAPTNNQLLFFDSATSLWKNKSVTTADIADSLNKRYITDAQQTVIGNTSGTNSGDNATNSQYSGLAASKEDTSNKQTDLTASATKFPTVNAVNTGLALKQDVATLLVDSIDKAILRNNYFYFTPNTITNGQAAAFGFSERLTGSTFVNLLNGNLLKGMVTFATTAIAGTIASIRRNDALQLQGYEFKFTRKIQFQSNVSGQRFFCGISKGNQFSPATNVEPNTLTDIVGVCQLSTSTNMHIVYNDAAGTATTVDLGSNYPCNDSQYNYYISVEQTTTSYIITVERVTVATGASISTSTTTATNIPNYATGVIQLFTFITNNATASIASYLDGGCIGSFKN